MCVAGACGFLTSSVIGSGSGDGVEESSDSVCAASAPSKFAAGVFFFLLLFSLAAGPSVPAGSFGGMLFVARAPPSPLFVSDGCQPMSIQLTDPDPY